MMFVTRREITQTYGHQWVLTLDQLEKVGLLKLQVYCQQFTVLSKNAYYVGKKHLSASKKVDETCVGR